MIRKVTIEDAPAIRTIYNEYILHTTITFEANPLSDEEMCKRIAFFSESFPYWVYEEDNTILGFCYAHNWKERAAYAKTWETSIYIAPTARGRGIGTKLMKQLIASCRARGIHALIACLAHPNEASVGLHTKLGFRKVSHYKEVGHKFDQWLDVCDYELIL